MEKLNWLNQQTAGHFAGRQATDRIFNRSKVELIELKLIKKP